MRCKFTRTHRQAKTQSVTFNISYDQFGNITVAAKLDQHALSESHVESREISKVSAKLAKRLWKMSQVRAS